MTFESPGIRDARIDIGAVIWAVVRRLPRIILVTLLLLGLAFVWLMFQPRLYESTASILVEPRSNFYTRSANEAAPTLTGGEAGVVSSQIELVKSRDTLLRVIDQLDLRSKSEFNGSAGGFSPFALVGQILGRSNAAPVSVDEVVLGNLYERLTVLQERDSRIISVIVRSTDPQLAADIANAVAYAHVARRAQLSLSDTAEASGWLGQEIDRLRVAVTEAETAVATFKVDNDLFTGSNNTSLLDQQLSTIANQITSAQERKNTALSRAALIRGMIQRGQALDGIADVRESVVIQRLSEEKARLQGERAQSSATLLPNHPTIQAINAQINELNNQISIEGRRVAEALEAEAQIEADLEVSLQADLDRLKGTASTATQDTVTLDSLEREATAQRTLLEGYLQRYGEALSRTETESTLPDVRVVTAAAPSVAPASPKTQLVLLAVGLVALLAQLGIVVFAELMSGRAIIPVAVVPRQDELEQVPFDPEELEPDQTWEDPELAVAEPTEVVAATMSEPIEPTEWAVEVSPAPTQSEAEATIAALASEGAIDLYVAIDEDIVGPMEVVAPVLAETIEPDEEPEAVEEEPVMQHASSLDITAFSELSGDMLQGRARLIILAGHQSNLECESLAEELIGDALSRGLSAALVDAGSGRRSEEPGLSDLSLAQASFGDVVHKSADNTFAEVPWGFGRAIARNSGKPATLVEALGDIYEVVVLMTGKVGIGSSLPMFEGLDGRLILVAGDEDDIDAVARSRDQLIDAGFAQVEVSAVPARAAA
jgi:succinoglycan biosynthesis transport protein ExoP